MRTRVFAPGSHLRSCCSATLFVTTTLALLGCAGTPEPIAEMASARTAVRSVQDTDARRLAPVQLDRAKTKLSRAEAAMREKEYDEAKRLAEEALADAQLARAEADAAIAEQNAAELEESIRVLRSEIDRARGVN